MSSDGPPVRPARGAVEPPDLMASDGSSGPRPRGTGEPSSFAAMVLYAVESIPPGRVMTYGDVAEYAGLRSARTVGMVLAADGETVPWHRVLRADGSLAPHIADEQRGRLLAEGVRFRGARVELAAFRWDGQSTSAE